MEHALGTQPNALSGRLRHDALAGLGAQTIMENEDWVVEALVEVHPEASIKRGLEDLENKRHSGCQTFDTEQQLFQVFGILATPVIHPVVKRARGANSQL